MVPEYTAMWIMWGAMFLAVEASAIFNKQPGDTLSEHIWHWFRITDKPRQWTIRRAVLAGSLTWLLIHMVAGF